jgi:hypothetical protein
LAKKARTPKPPRPAASGQRPVQAPKKRSGPSRTAKVPTSSTGGRSWFWPLAAVVVGLLIIGSVLGVVLTRSSTKLTPSLTSSIKWKDLPGLLTTKPPWSRNTSLLAIRTASIGLQPPGQETLVYHIHQHLDLWVDGKKVTVPQAIGININEQAQTASFAEIHTHNTLGIIHVETGRPVTFTLGQFFGVWGVRLTRNCIGSFKGSCGRVQWWLNGKKQTGNPEKLVLKNHEEIALVLGKPPAKIPSTFDWSANGI